MASKWKSGQQKNEICNNRQYRCIAFSKSNREFFSSRLDGYRLSTVIIHTLLFWSRSRYLQSKNISHSDISRDFSSETDEKIHYLTWLLTKIDPKGTREKRCKETTIVHVRNLSQIFTSRERMGSEKANTIRFWWRGIRYIGKEGKIEANRTKESVLDPWNNLFPLPPLLISHFSFSKTRVSPGARITFHRCVGPSKETRSFPPPFMAILL